MSRACKDRRALFVVALACASLAGFSSPREDVLSKLRQTAASPNYYWAWTHAWLDVDPNRGDRTHVIERAGRVVPRPTADVALVSACQKYSGGLRPIVNYSDLCAVSGIWQRDIYYQVNRAGLTASIKRHWKELGGLQVFSWHMDQPYFTNGFRRACYRFKSEGTNRNVVRQILDGTGGPCGSEAAFSPDARKPFANPRAWFMASLKDVADFLNGLVDDETGAKIPVILRYPHECDGTWFWWGNSWCAPDEYRRLCRMEADYLRKACGNDQIIFAYTPDRTWRDFGREGDTNNTFLAWYPGDEYVDVIGIDDYSIGNGDDADVEMRLNETVRRLRQMTAFARPRGLVVGISESGGKKKRDDFWQYLHRAATAEGVEVAFVNTWSGVYGMVPATPAAEADEKAFAARPQVLLESKDVGFRSNNAKGKENETTHEGTRCRSGGTRWWHRFSLGGNLDRRVAGPCERPLCDR